MRVAIHQPNFMPWLGFFHKALSVDVFILFDDVVMSNNPSYENHARIKTANGAQEITIPISVKPGQLICEAKLAHVNWKKILRTISFAYQQAKHAGPLLEFLEQVVGLDAFLLDLNARLLRMALHFLGGGPSWECSACLGNPSLTGEDRIIDLVKAVGGDTYLSGTGAGSKRYLVPEHWEAAGIKLEWQQFTHPVYPQLHGDFVPGLSILDLLMNCGPDSRKILMGEVT